jgi:hypothetical protein
MASVPINPIIPKRLRRMVMILPHHLFHCLAGHAHGGAGNTLGRVRLAERRWRPPVLEFTSLDKTLYPESVGIINMRRQRQWPDFVGGSILS